MFLARSAQIVSGALAVLTSLGLLHYKPWATKKTLEAHSGVAVGEDGRQHLTVGFLPVT